MRMAVRAAILLAVLGVAMAVYLVWAKPAQQNRNDNFNLETWRLPWQRLQTMA